ncbi:endonuclease domain-containing protein [Ruminococcus sp.]|uniref:endonuclease domain-containing protein n=1 Tax=Ruminococcus sp. TaxID=41978 RepID=UPI00386572FD
MNKYSNPRLTENAQSLRRNMTKEEKHLWYDCLKNLPITVKRQKVFGKYIADFYIPKAKIVIELDGSQHYSQEGEKADAARDDYFVKNGFIVLRDTNLQIQQEFKNVCEDIWYHIDPFIDNEM